jgi:hypothetical protein
MSMTTTEALRTAADAMRRADPAYCAAHQVQPITDGEWDAVIELVEDACEAAPPAPSAEPSAEPEQCSECYAPQCTVCADMDCPGKSAPQPSAEPTVARVADAVAAERARCAAVCDDEVRIRVQAGNTHPSESPERDRCMAAANGARNCAEGIRSGEVVAAQPSAESVEWLLAQCEEYQRRAHEAERLISRMRGQWIHSVHAGECLALLASIGQPQPNAPEAKEGGR